MIKDIKYRGYSTSPSDYECPDGSLAASLNLIAEDAQIKGIPSPSELLSLQDGETLVLIHNVPTQKNYILARPETDGAAAIYWMEKGDATDTDSATLITACTGLRDIVAIGNTIVLALDSGIEYLLWKDDAYKCLGSRPPFVSIDFGMYKSGTLLDSHKRDIPASCAPTNGGGQSGTHATADAIDKADLAELTQMAYGLLNSTIAEKVTEKGLFYQPFFIRYAYRLYDGSYSWHSAPILMLPNILPPKIKFTANGSASDGKLPSTLTLAIPFFSLSYRILSDVSDTLANWSDIVSGIDVFASAPIYTYDQSKDLPSPPIVNEQQMLRRLSVDDTRTHIFVGHYAEGINAKYEDVLYPLGDSGSQDLVLNIERHERFTNNILSTHDFYKIAEIDVKDVAAMASMTSLELKDKNLSSLVARPTLSDDYQSHRNIVATSLYSFNSRLNLTGLSIAPAEPFPIRSLMQFGNPDGDTVQCSCVKVWSRANGVRCFAMRQCSDSAQEDAWVYPAGNFPRYIYYPDASAYKMEITISGGQKFIIDLKPHDFLNGAYFFDEKYGLDVNSTPENTAPETDVSISLVNIQSKIYTSEVNNPFCFPALGVNTVGSGEVYAVCSAAKALSQGQFGQFPLYAFTSEGVWALETSQTGSYVARQPITRDVLLLGSKPLQMDGAVVFATDRGLMTISGSQAQCISDYINGFSQVQLLDHGTYTCFPIVPFSTFLAESGMLYDYAHQRVIVFNPAYTYAYVYSLKSSEWGMIHSNIRSGVNSYPEALAISNDNKLLNYSSPDGLPTKGLLITRPIKLEMPDVLKTIGAAVQRGNFAKGHVQSVLYGSRNLINWHIVWSSTDHFIRGFGGTPYKYFRIVLLTQLSAGESIFGTTLKFTPRHTNQLR